MQARVGGAFQGCVRHADVSGRAGFRTSAVVAGRRVGILRRMVRVGIGYDVHALVAGRPLVLGGVEIPHTHGLEGHSDADALMHAICDAVLGALGAGDIGQHFPNTDPRWKGVPSRIFLEEAARQVRQRGGRILNVDATVVAQQPRLAPHVTAMRTNIAAALGLSPGQVGVKATTNEGLGFLGRGEGIAALAVAAVELPVEGEQRGTSAV